MAEAAVATIRAEIPGNDPDLLSELLMSLLQAEKGMNKNSTHCHQCDDNSLASWRCEDCRMGLCDNCQSRHTKVPLLSRHRVVARSTADDGSQGDQTAPVLDEVLFCTIHKDKQLEINCRDCQQAICVLCFMTDHKDHEAETVAEALETLMPKISASVAGVEKNIEVLEAQIQALAKSKEDYIAKRREFDDGTDQGGDEEEAKALSALEDYSKSLNSRINLCKNLVTLANTCMTKCTNVSLLRAVQGDLVRILAAESSKQPKLSPTISLEEVQNKHELINKLASLSSLTDLAKMGSSSQFSSKDLEILPNMKLTPGDETRLTGSYRTRMSYIDDEIWIPSTEASLMEVFSLTGERKKLQTPNKLITSCRQLFNGDIATACLNGLWVTTNHCDQWKLIQEGQFSDVCAHGNYLSGIDCEKSVIFTFQLVEQDDGTRMWKVLSQFKVKKLCAKNVQQSFTFTACSQYDNTFAVTTLYPHSLNLYQNGTLTIEADLKYPVHICGVDEQGNIVSVNWRNGSLIVHEPEKMTVLGTYKLPISESKDVLYDTNGEMWILKGRVSDVHKLVKISSREMTEEEKQKQKEEEERAKRFRDFTAFEPRNMEDIQKQIDEMMAERRKNMGSDGAPFVPRSMEDIEKEIAEIMNRRKLEKDDMSKDGTLSRLPFVPKSREEIQKEVDEIMSKNKDAMLEGFELPKSTEELEKQVNEIMNRHKIDPSMIPDVPTTPEGIEEMEKRVDEILKRTSAGGVLPKTAEGEVPAFKRPSFEELEKKYESMLAERKSGEQLAAGAEVPLTAPRSIEEMRKSIDEVVARRKSSDHIAQPATSSEALSKRKSVEEIRRSIEDMRADLQNNHGVNPDQLTHSTSGRSLADIQKSIDDLMAARKSSEKLAENQ